MSEDMTILPATALTIHPQYDIISYFCLFFCSKERG